MLSLAQVVFTVAGFIVAIYQLRRTAVATEANTELLRKMRVRLLGNDLLVLLPELQRMEDDMVTAAKAGNPDVVERQLVVYARAATHVGALLEDDGEAREDALIQMLKQASKAATKAKAELAQGLQRPLSDAVQLALEKMLKTSMEISAAVARLQRRVDS